MKNDRQAPATKEDIALLMEQIGKLYDANEQWKDEIKQYFDIVAENIKYDLLKGALNDKVAQHEDRIVRLEKHAGLARV